MSDNAIAADTKSPEKQRTIVWRKQLSRFGAKKSHRRISCKDLGFGDCEGWLMMKISRPLRDHWSKYWFKLKDRNLYYYKDPQDDSYRGRFIMTGFEILPGNNSHKSTLQVFQVRHPDCGSYFLASDRQEDMVKWMNHLISATLDYSNNNKSTQYYVGFHSGSDDDSADADTETSVDLDEAVIRIEPSTNADVRSTSSAVKADQSEVSVTQPQIGSLNAFVDDYTQVIDSFQKLHINVVAELTGGRKNSRRRQTPETGGEGATAALRPFASPSTPQDIHGQHLQALKRTLKDKESQLAAICELLRAVPISSDMVAQFRQQFPSIVSVAEEQPTEARSCGM